MAEITVPRWLIANKCMPGGRRTAPKPVLVIETPARLGKRFGAYEAPVIAGQFEHWEYRFWAMGVIGNTGVALTECRCCGHVGKRDMKIRRLHLSQGGCATKLCEAYKLLLRDRKCVVCDQKTLFKKWGVPICSSSCEQAWCEVEAHPSALQAALQLVKGD